MQNNSVMSFSIMGGLKEVVLVHKLVYCKNILDFLKLLFTDVQNFNT